MNRISMDELIEFGVRFLVKRGVPEGNARYVSNSVVQAEAFRQTTHGIVQFSVIHDALGKQIDAQAEPRIVQQTLSTAMLDAERCMGALAMKLAKELAVKKARENGIGFVCVRNTEWIGAVGVYLISIARQGLLAQAWAQTSGCKDCAPFGGVDPRFSTNPVALAFPTDGDPVLADFSTATMSLSGANALIKEGRQADTPRFLDTEGNPGKDPSVIEKGGTLMFAGCDVDGHKGYALSLFNEALTVLAGGSANNPELPGHQSFALMVLDPAAFAGPEYYFKEMKRFIAHVRSSRSRSGFEGIRLPGERGFAALADCRANGICLDKDKLAMLRKLAEDNQVEPNPF